MKCTNKLIKATALLLVATLLSGCNSKALIKEYKASDNGSVWKAQDSRSRSEGMAADLCVVNENIIPEDMEALEGAGAAGLFDISNEKVLYASNIHEKVYPASLTKVMTALLLLENYQGDFQEKVTASKHIVITESGAQLCGYKKGDQVSLEQLLHALLIYSGNDAALMIAEYVSGSIDEFINLMNQKAVQLGATNTHFVNPHGLHDEEHYTTAYDLYLIFQSAMKYDMFREVINKKEYTGQYTKADGSTKKVSWKSTNQFFSGNQTAPEGVVIIGGKTGTTNAAGACLILLSQNVQGSDYISVVLRDTSRDTLYADMIKLLGEINK